MDNTTAIAGETPVVRFTKDGIATRIERFEEKLHVRSTNLSAFIPTNAVRFLETENSDTKLMASNAGGLELMIPVPSDAVNDIKRL